MGILDALMGSKDKDKGEEAEEAAPESKSSPKTGYRTLIKEAAEDGDWDAFADAVAGFCKQSMK